MDIERLLKLRLVVARFGEMDAAEWWNTKGVLSRLGSSVFARGFPRTDLFAQGKTVFEVARLRCQEVFNPPGAITLWDLPPQAEDIFESEWRSWCADRDAWLPFFGRLQTLNREDLFVAFNEAGLFASDQQEAVRKLRRGTEGRSIPITGHKSLDDGLVDLLALGFCKGAKRELLVPFASHVEVPTT